MGREVAWDIFINGMEKFNFNSLQTQENRPGII